MNCLGDGPFGPRRRNPAGEGDDHRAHRLVRDDHRVTIDDFRTTYSNRFSAREISALRDRYPTVASYVEEGLVLTKLEAILTELDFTERPSVESAPTDEEFRLDFASARRREGLGVPFLALPLRTVRRAWARRRNEARV